jgi:hypothetical protein
MYKSSMSVASLPGIAAQGNQYGPLSSTVQNVPAE